MKNFTPGPWEITIWTSEHSGEFVIHNGVTICRGDDKTVHWEANAHLIAAAPELLANLEEMTQRYAHLEQLYFDACGLASDGANGTIAKAREIINKAKGL